jgi:hypothetical protein
MVRLNSLSIKDRLAGNVAIQYLKERELKEQKE